jgi:hypothetical protein
VGAEHVSYSAVLTLRQAGVRPVALVTDLPRTQTFRAFDVATRLGLRVPVWTGTSVRAITGRGQVDGVLVQEPDGTERVVAVETVVFTGDFMPDNELVRLASLSMDAGTHGPVCSADGLTSAPGVFAAGNLVHPAETADVVAVRARRVGQAAASWLTRGGTPTSPRGTVRLQVADPLLWVVPNLVESVPAGTGSFLLRTKVFLEHPRLDVTQAGRLLGSYRLRRMIPNRSHRVPSDWLRLVRPGEDVHLTVS